MSLVKEQHLFLLDVAKLINRIANSGMIVTGGELYRTAEQQAIYVKSGLSTTTNSKHLVRLAIDLNFFVIDANGNPKLTYDKSIIKPFGDYWESLAPGKNKWGGNWATFKDVPHFERNA